MSHGTSDAASGGHAAATGELSAWRVPGWFAALAGTLLAGRLARSAPWSGFDQAVEQASTGGALLAIEACALPSFCAAAGSRIAVVLPDTENTDAIAELAAACCLVTRYDGDGTAPVELHSTDPVPVLVLTPGTASPAWAAAIAAALARPVIAAAVRPRRGAFRFGHLFSTPIDIAWRGADAAARGPLAPPANAESAARFAAALERSFELPPAPIRSPDVSRHGGPWVRRAAAIAMTALSPLARPYLALRLRRGKEERGRLGERLGQPGAARPDGRLLWVHAASVGESLSVLPMIEALQRRGLADWTLITTGTVTSAGLVARRKSECVLHQYVPLDVPRYARRFLDHWRPSAAIFVESEIWPNLMAATAARDIPLAIVNGRLSDRSFARWRRVPSAARAIFGLPVLVLAQSRQYAAHFAALGARDARHVGNLKFDSPAPEAGESELKALRQTIGSRPVWLAASTHEGEEAIVTEAHIAMRERHPDLLTIIAPRHPDRAPAIAAALESRWLVSARRSAGQEVDGKIDIYLADTMGELGLFYRLARIAFVGGSLVPVGGHNPIEPAQVECAILHGPHVHNFTDAYGALGAVGGTIVVADAGELARHAGELIGNAERRAELTSASRAEIARNAGSLERALGALAPLFDR